MTDRGSDITARDRRAAEKWVMRMLDEPERYAQGLSNWIAQKPARRDLYLTLMRDVEAAGQAAADIKLPEPQYRASFTGLWKALPVFAVAALLVGLLIAVGIFSRSPDPSTTQITAKEESPTAFRTKVGEVRTEQLADGSVLILDTDTVALVTIDADSRVVELRRGRARFTVAHDKSRPFFVRAGGVETRATGTVFDVTFRDSVSVHLIEGGVEIRVTGRAGGLPQQKLILRPGQFLAVTHGQYRSVAVISAQPSEQQWVNGVKSFDNVAIGDIISEANTYSSTKIELSEPALGQQALFADLDIRNIERVAEAISGFLDLTIDRSRPNRLLLVPKK